MLCVGTGVSVGVGIGVSVGVGVGEGAVPCDKVLDVGVGLTGRTKCVNPLRSEMARITAITPATRYTGRRFAFCFFARFGVGIERGEGVPGTGFSTVGASWERAARSVG